MSEVWQMDKESLKSGITVTESVHKRLYHFKNGSVEKLCQKKAAYCVISGGL